MSRLPASVAYLQAAMNTALADAFDLGAAAAFEIAQPIDDVSLENPYRVSVLESITELEETAEERFSGIIWSCPSCHASGARPTQDEADEALAEHLAGEDHQ